MENELMKLAATQGIWTFLFVSLFLYTLKRNSQREDKYQSTIDKLADKLGVIDIVRKDVEDIKEMIKK